MVAVEVEQVGAALTQLLRAPADSATDSIQRAAASLSNSAAEFTASEWRKQ